MPTTTAVHVQLLLLILLNATALAGDTIFWIRFVRKMKGFDWFVSQALYPLSVGLVLYSMRPEMPREEYATEITGGGGGRGGKSWEEKMSQERLVPIVAQQ